MEMTPALEARDLRFRYPDGVEALRGVSFAVGAGESVGLIGPNGAGKSTLLLHLNGLLPESHNGPSSIWVEGLPVSADNLPDIRRRVGLLFQDANDQLFCPTVFEDVAFGPRQLGLAEAEVACRVADALAQVGLAGFDARAPHHLSGGEKRRACLAGVLACQPSILVLDEPTSSLDPKGRRELKELLARITLPNPANPNPLSMLIATHDLEMVVELCSRVIVLDKGVVAAEGPTHTLLSNEPLMLQHGLERPHILRHPHPH
jgi:cobalt/nickel transport system ATP-binding protein